MTALLLRDLRLALRAGGGFGLGLAFFLIVTVLVPFTEPTLDDGAWAVFVVLETPRGDTVLVQTGVARLN